jgi:beta-lactamase class A VEB
MKLKITQTLILFLLFNYSFAQTSILKDKIQKVIENKKAKVGISIIANNFKDTININGNQHFPMQSVYKFPIALAILSKANQSKFNLNQQIEISKKDLHPDTWSPIREHFPNGTSMTISNIIKYTVAQSDNNGCDILLRLLGGTKEVQKFLSKNKLKDISIKATEDEAHQDWNLQYQNWATPIALTNLLTSSYELNKNRLLSGENYKFLWKTMEETSTGMKRLRGQLPAKTFVAHKTGTSGAKNNLTPATNDIGVIQLPNGTLIFISVLVSNSTESEEVNEKIISDIAKLTWDFYLKQEQH